MQHFHKIAENADVLPLLHAVVRQPGLWNAHRWRTTYQGTPHADVSDIWLRYSDPDKTARGDVLTGVQNDLEPVWYPAWGNLPQARGLVLDLMRRVEAAYLGRVLITKLPPGGRIAAHRDAAGDYTADPLGARYHVVLQGNPGSLFRASDETVCMRSGEVWWFDHNAEHEVINNSNDDRIHLLVDVRLAP